MHPRSPFADRYAARAFAIEELAKKAGGGLMEEIAALPPAAKGALLGGAGGIVSGLVSDQPGSVLRHGLIGAGLGAAGGWGGSALMDYLAAHGGGEEQPPFETAPGSNQLGKAPTSIPQDTNEQRYGISPESGRGEGIFPPLRAGDETFPSLKTTPDTTPDTTPGHAGLPTYSGSNAPVGSPASLDARLADPASLRNLLSKDRIDAVKNITRQLTTDSPDARLAHPANGKMFPSLQGKLENVRENWKMPPGWN